MSVDEEDDDFDYEKAFAKLDELQRLINPTGSARKFASDEEALAWLAERYEPSNETADELLKRLHEISETIRREHADNGEN